MWVVYFCSRTDLEFVNVRTLRKLLRMTSKQWLLGNPADPQPELERIFSDKARASITVLGILTAVAGLELVQVNSILLSGRWASADMGLWRVLMVDGATLAAIAAIVLLLISADSLDSIFNRFAIGEADALLKSRFYTQSVTPRYRGLLMLMFGAAILVAFHEPQLASMAIAVIIVAGYRHWFPRVTFGAAAGESATQPRTRETGRRVGNIIASVALILAPMFLANGWGQSYKIHLSSQYVLIGNRGESLQERPN
jgi:hypothetical protein